MVAAAPETLQRAHDVSAEELEESAQDRAADAT
jgi:hypothetical protein